MATVKISLRLFPTGITGKIVAVNGEGSRGYVATGCGKAPFIGGLAQRTFLGHDNHQDLTALFHWREDSIASNFVCFCFTHLSVD